MAIPDELRASLRGVFELIQQSQRDPDIKLDFDDAIQIGAVCGGRNDKKPRPYVLTYYPRGDSRRGRWFLTLHQTEIEDIVDGRLNEISMYCCASPNCRSKFREADGPCFFCDYEEDEATVRMKKRLEELAMTVHSKDEWVRSYLREKPDATSMSLIRDYNAIEGLGKRLGWFSFPEADDLIARCRRNPNP